MASILAKANRYLNGAEGKRRIRELTDKVMLGEITLSSGGGRGTIHTPEEAADKFIEVLRRTIASSGLSIDAFDAISDFDYTRAVKVGDKYIVNVYFVDDMHRDSLYPMGYNGISDLASLLDSGYSAKNYVYGDWHGERIRSRTTFPGVHFMDQAVADFMGNYASEYNVDEIRINRYDG